MATARNPDRIIGGLLFFQLVGLILPFVLLHPLNADPRSYLAAAGGAAFQIKLAVFLLFANCTLTIGITIAAFRIFRQYSEAMAVWLLAASVIMFLLQAVDNVQMLSMLSLSQQYALAGGPAPLFEMTAAVVRSTRRWAHLTELVAIDGWIFIFYSVLYRYSLVPRWVTVFGLVTVVLHFAGIPSRMFLGDSPITLMGVPMAASHITLATWLVARGFDGHGPGNSRR